MADLELTLEEILPPVQECKDCGEPTAARNGLGQPHCFSCFIGQVLEEQE